MGPLFLEPFFVGKTETFFYLLAAGIQFFRHCNSLRARVSGPFIWLEDWSILKLQATSWDFPQLIEKNIHFWFRQFFQNGGHFGGICWGRNFGHVFASENVFFHSPKIIHFCSLSKIITSCTCTVLSGSFNFFCVTFRRDLLPKKTKIGPEKRWLEDDPFLFNGVNFRRMEKSTKKCCS